MNLNLIVNLMAIWQGLWRPYAILSSTSSTLSMLNRGGGRNDFVMSCSIRSFFYGDLDVITLW